MLKKILLFCMMFIFVSTPIYSQEKQTTYVPNGDKVSVDSICFTLPAALQLKLDLQYCGKEIELECEKKIEKLTIEWNTKIEISKLQYETDINKLSFENKQLTSHIDFLTSEVEKLDKPAPWYRSNGFYFAIGVLSGSAVIIGGAYVFHLINTN